MTTFDINALVGDRTQRILTVIDIDGPAPPEVAHVLRMGHDQAQCSHPMCRAYFTLICPTSDEIDAWHEANPRVTWQAGFWLAIMDKPRPLNELALSGWVIATTWLSGAMDR